MYIYTMYMYSVHMYMFFCARNINNLSKQSPFMTTRGCYGAILKCFHYMIFILYLVLKSSVSAYYRFLQEMATVVHSVHCMMGLDSMPTTAGTEMSVEEQVDRLFMVRNYM